MAVSSPLNPSSIVKERSEGASSSGAQNFITGGSPLGSGVVASAANKIVGFSRSGASGVAAKPPDLQSIISTLSSSILNNVENRVTSINQNVTQVVQGKLKELESEHRQRMQTIDAAKPNAILNNFLTLYKEAIGYIQFLGNRNNIKSLGDNLKGLQNVFAEAFNVARTIRETIKRTVGQLSSLPKASTGGGGLSLDIGIPGAGLRMGGMGKLARAVRKGRLPLMLGGAALAGGLGSKVVSGMMDLGGDDVQGVSMGEGKIPGTLLDKFDGILERFSKAIKTLTSGSRTTSSAGASLSSASMSEDSSSPDNSNATTGTGATPSAPPGAGAAGPQGAATRALLDTIAFAEGTEGKGDRGYNIQFGGGQFQGYESHPDQVIHGGRYSSAAAGRYQFMPDTWEGLGGKTKRQGGFDFSPENQDKQAVVLTIRRLNAAGIRVNNENELESLLQKEGLSPRIQAALAPEWASFPTAAGVSAYGQPVKKQQKLTEVFQSRFQSQQGAAKVTTPPPTVEPAKTQSENNQVAAKTVAQPPPIPDTVVSVAPMSAASPQTQSGGSQKMIPPRQKLEGGASVPFLTSSNNDNFLTLYSRMVYNVVDG